MATDLTTIFGSAIKVSPQFRRQQRSYHGYVGAHGMTSTWLGTRGYPLIISGRIYGNGGTYALARADLLTAVDAIETYLWAEAASYTFQGGTYEYVIFDSFELIPGAEGKTIHSSDGYCWADFICRARNLI